MSIKISAMKTIERSAKNGPVISVIGINEAINN